MLYSFVNDSVVKWTPIETRALEMIATIPAEAPQSASRRSTARVAHTAVLYGCSFANTWRAVCSWFSGKYSTEVSVRRRLDFEGRLHGMLCWRIWLQLTFSCADPLSSIFMLSRPGLSEIACFHKGRCQHLKRVQENDLRHTAVCLEKDGRRIGHPYNYEAPVVWSFDSFSHLTATSILKLSQDMWCTTIFWTF
jgi:hypothetical protein